MLDAPTRPFVKGVEGPVPAVFLEEGDDVAQPLARPFRPGGGAELADVDFRPVAELEVANRGEFFAQEILVPALLRIGPSGFLPRLASADALMRKGEGLIDVNLVDDILQREGAERLEPRRRSRVDRLDDDRDGRIDFADRPRRPHLERKRVVARDRVVGLMRLVHEVIGADRRSALETAGDAPPSLHEMVRELRFVEHVELVVGGASAWRHVQIDHDLDAVFRGKGNDALFEVVQLHLHPGVVVREVALRVGIDPVAAHLVAHERDAPRGELGKVFIVQAARGEHEAAERAIVHNWQLPTIVHNWQITIVIAIGGIGDL